MSHGATYYPFCNYFCPSSLIVNTWLTLFNLTPTKGKTAKKSTKSSSGEKFFTGDCQFEEKLAYLDLYTIIQVWILRVFVASVLGDCQPSNRYFKGCCHHPLIDEASLTSVEMDAKKYVAWTGGRSAQLLVVY